MRKKMKQMMKSMKNEDDVYSFLKPVRTGVKTNVVNRLLRKCSVRPLLLQGGGPGTKDSFSFS